MGCVWGQGKLVNESIKVGGREVERAILEWFFLALSREPN